MAQNSIIELQVINYVLKNKSLSLLKDENISPNQFSDVYRDIIEYIYTHEKKYGVVPDETTIVASFNDYTPLEVNESPKYLVDKLKSFLAYVQFGKEFVLIKKEMDDGNTDYALSLLKKSSDDALKIFTGRVGLGVDITKDVSRVDEYEKRLSGDGEEMYSLGLESLDNAFGGILKDDIMLVFARLAHGKSYLLTYFAHALHKQGLNVLFYSGEMEATQVGYRYDSINANFSNKSLLFGKQLDEGRTTESYRRYLETLKDCDNYFKVVTPADLGGRFLNMNDVHKMVEDLKPDVIFVDQLSLMEDIRSTKVTQDRIKYGNIMADLRVLANTKRIPIIIAAQANRMSATKDEDGEFSIPEMSHISESDAIGHHCTRAVAFCTNKVDESSSQMMKIAIRKNRHGGADEFKVTVDFEHGRFTELKQKPLRADSFEGTGAF